MTPIIVGYAFDVPQPDGQIGWVRSSAFGVDDVTREMGDACSSAGQNAMIAL
jgi:hypothetical protein